MNIQSSSFNSPNNSVSGKTRSAGFGVVYISDMTLTIRSFKAHPSHGTISYLDISQFSWDPASIYKRFVSDSRRNVTAPFIFSPLTSSLRNLLLQVYSTVTMSPNHINPPFRADHIGSFLRPASLLLKRQQLHEGKVTKAELIAEEDKAIIDIVTMQQEVGIKGITDGEFRRVS